MHFSAAMWTFASMGAEQTRGQTVLGAAAETWLEEVGGASFCTSKQRERSQPAIR